MAIAAAPAQALEVGISDQDASAFQDGRLKALGLREARLIVPWDAATSEPAAVQAWLDAAAADGMAPHVAFGHLAGEKCPSRPCQAPSRSQFRAAVRAFINRFPQVRTYTSWNEANHESQPTATAPVAVAGYYEELRSACPACTIVAADVIDSGSYVNWLRRFRAALTVPTPQLWGLHNYTDVTFGTTSGTDAALAAVPGTLWIEETGGIVVRRDGRGRELLRYDETRAARAIDNAFEIAATRPRIARMYLYEWRAAPTSVFDSGLVRPDGTKRASYDELVAQLRSLASSSATTPRTSWRARWSRTARRMLILRATCRPAGSRCRGSLRIALRTLTRGSHRTLSVRLAGRRYSTTAGHATATLRIRLSPALARRARAALRRSLALTVRDRGRSSRRVVLTLARTR
jgi:Glycosyl hydrolase catalytic core